MSRVLVGPRAIGAGQPCFVIAEAGVNHNGDVALARKLVDAAADCGADAVKFQTFDPAQLASARAPKAEYQHRGDASGSQRAMLEKLVLPKAAHAELKARAEARGLLFMSSPFDEQSADLLDELGVPAFKVPSGEVTNHPYLEHLAKKGRAMLMSTGMCTLADVEAAVAVIRNAGNPPLALFHCVSSYPARAEDSNLRAMETLRRTFSVPVGWSDHTDGIEMSVAAVALGSELIEKHITLDRELPGPDHKASLDPAVFARLVAAIRDTERALGSGIKAPVAAEAPIAAVARKSLHWRDALPAGAIVTRAHLVALRPGTGMPPGRLTALVGKTLARAVEAGAAVEEQDLT